MAPKNFFFSLIFTLYLLHNKLIIYFSIEIYLIFFPIEMGFFSIEIYFICFPIEIYFIFSMEIYFIFFH